MYFFKLHEKSFAFNNKKKTIKTKEFNLFYLIKYYINEVMFFI